MKATVYKSTGSWYNVKTADGNSYQARIKGIFKIDDISSTNPVTVGDEVEIEIENDLENSVMITEIYERKNYIARSSPHGRGQHHIVASNLDLCLVFASLKDPKTSQGFIDRLLVAAEAFHVKPAIVFNKADLYRKKELEKFDELNSIYTKIGYKVFLVSVHDENGVDAVKDTLKTKTTLLCGHSGVGKSTFINLIMPGFNIKTNEVSGWSGKGVHTTTFAEMFDLPFGGRIIDTPGVREFGVIDITKQELSHYFPEMRILINSCRFNNCHHINEPGCAVKDALIRGEVSAERYQSYCNILTSINDVNY